MKAYSRKISTVVLTLMVVAVFAPSMVLAEVTRVEIKSRQDVLGGKEFGAVGSYEKLVGKVYFAVDPKDPRNQIIADIENAPRNPQGKVEFSSDFAVLKPKDPSRGNNVAFFDILN